MTDSRLGREEADRREAGATPEQQPEYESFCSAEFSDGCILDPAADEGN
mgnify:CR=1 FL=1